MRTLAIAALAAAAWAAAASAQDNAAALKDLAPTGKLRVAIAVSPAPSALYAIKDGSGQYRGVAVDLGTGLAKKLGVPLELVPYLASGEITEAAGQGVWDVTFMPYDAERAKHVDFGAAYHLLQSTYLVAPNSSAQTLAEVDRPGMRIAGVANTATARAAAASLKTATVVAVKGVDEAVEFVRDGKADAIGLSRESLTGLLAKLPGSRILDGGFLNSVTAVAVPKGRPAALAYVSAFVEDEKAAGNVRRSFDAVGLTTSMVAPAGMRP
ncbi:MAG TPA: transporter substrate-binding domain-containing protein [Beijerinckiaceae bacterium]|jgi:polar amino acid transport system substrate-binding protein|nr:transporter substrate-binding domain-containing protein [Beijerinckiaceae bacterium]